MFRFNGLKFLIEYKYTTFLASFQAISTNIYFLKTQIIGGKLL